MLFGYFHGLDIDRNIRQNGIFSTRCCDVIRFSRFVPYGFGIADQRGIFGDGAHHADDIQILKAVDARISVVRNAFQVILSRNEQYGKRIAVGIGNSAHSIDGTRTRSCDRGADVVSDGSIGAGAKRGCLFMKVLYVGDCLCADDGIDDFQNGAPLVPEKMLYVFSDQKLCDIVRNRHGSVLLT